MDMKLRNQVSKLISSKIGNMDNLVVRELLEIAPLTAIVNPEDRPSLQEIRESLLPHTRERKPLREPSCQWYTERSILRSRFSGIESDIGGWDPESQLDASTPKELRQQLYEHVLNVANHGAPVERVKAMHRLGMFFLTAFGTSKSIQSAFTWFCRSAAKGSVRGMEMVFRLEKATKHAPLPLAANIKTKTRVQWAMACLLKSMASFYDPRLSPESVDLNDIHSRMDEVLESLDPIVLLDALQDDIESNIVALALQNKEGSIDGEKTLQHARQLSQGSSYLQSILDAVCDDNVPTLDRLLQTKESLPPGFLDLLVTVSANRNRWRVLRSLVLNHGADPDTVEALSGQKSTSLVDSILRDDYAMAMTLIDCGANTNQLWAHGMMSSIAANQGSSIMRLALSHLLSVKIGEKPSYVNLLSIRSLCHQHLDGIYPSVVTMYHKTGEVPPDSNQLPPLFQAVGFNSLDKLQALLTNGADPNIRFEGISPIHLAVRLLHPTAVLLLLEFGANPNSLNSCDGYITPLHALSQGFITISPKLLRNFRHKADYLGRSWQIGEYGQKRHSIQQTSVIIHLLLQYGADPATCCIDGFTPLMMSMVSPARESDTAFTLLVRGGITLNDRTTRGETILHIAARMKDVPWLRQILYITGTQLINCRDNLLCTPLFLAAQGGDCPEALETLLSKGADSSIRGILNLSCLDIAVLEGNRRSLSILLDHITKLPTRERRRIFTAKDTCGRTPLHTCLASDDFALACTYLRRLLRFERYFSYHLLTSHDYFEATPIEYAHKVGNEAALRVIVQHFVPSSFGLVRISNLPPWWKLESTRDKDPALSSLKTYQSLQQILNEPSHKDLARCYDASEFSFPKKALSAVEEGWERCLETWQREDGYQSKRVILCMNYFGTATERHGRLKKAHDLYYKGWTLARSLLGDQSTVTQDFACKFLRVSRDRGLEESVSVDVAKWHKLHGRNTLEPSHFAFRHSHNDLGNAASKLLDVEGFQDKVSQQCDRPNCGKRANFACPGCNHIHYCSQACRVADMTDPKVQHHLACLRAEPLASSLAVKFIPESSLHSRIRSFAQEIWNIFREQCPQAPETLPPLKSFFTMTLSDEEEFTVPVHTRLEANILLYWQQSAHEIRYSMRQVSPWLPCTAGRMFTSYRPVSLCIRPICSNTGGSPDKGKDHTLGWGFVVDYNLIEVDPAYQNGRITI